MNVAASLHFIYNFFYYFTLSTTSFKSINFLLIYCIINKKVNFLQILLLLPFFETQSKYVPIKVRSIIIHASNYKKILYSNSQSTKIYTPKKFYNKIIIYIFNVNTSRRKIFLSHCKKSTQQ